MVRFFGAVRARVRPGIWEGAYAMSPSSRCSRCHVVGLLILDESGDSPLCPDCFEEVSANSAPDQITKDQPRDRHRLDSAAPPAPGSGRKRKKKRRAERKARRIRRKRLLFGAAFASLLLVVGVAVYWTRPGAQAAQLPVETPAERAAAPNASQPLTVVKAGPMVVAPPEPIADVEEVPAPAVELAWEQLDVMPALFVEAPKPVARQPGKIQRRRVIAEADLRDQLALAPEVGLTVSNVQMLADSYDANAKLGATDFQPGILLQVRPDLGALPVRARQLDPGSAATLGKLSKKLHAYVEGATPKDALGDRIDPAMLRQILSEEKRGKRMEWLRPEAVPVLRQILGHEQTPIRSLLIELLAEITGPRSSDLLAERAVFDLTPEVRQAAVEALRPRPREEFRHVLTNALRYPWAPAADHAAEALVALEDVEAVPQLVTLLAQPDPSAPYAGARGTTLQRQVVRVNHTASCLMCHPPALSRRDPVTGVVPGLQRITTGGGGWGGGQRPGASPFWVRADVTFFRQDFSESIASGPSWIHGQPTLRFDYLVRRRAVSPKDAKRLQEQYATKPTYEQREAVLYALRELTGKDPGRDYESWLALYPSADVDTEAARLLNKLLKAAPGHRDQVLTQLREAKGAAPTQALAHAIPKLPAAERSRAREALAKRLGRITADALRDKLQDQDAEIRRAAAAACAQRDDSSLVTDLIPLLNDEQRPVSAEALASLKGMTGQDLGNSAAAWQDWLKGEGPK
jgi:HEAT repeat protein